MKKYIVVTDNATGTEKIFTEFSTKKEALEFAENEWKQGCSAFIFKQIEI